MAQTLPATSAVVTDAAAPGVEKNLDAPGIQTIASGERFRITVPLRLAAAVNLGAAQLDIAVSRRPKRKKDEEDLHLIAKLEGPQASLKAGDRGVVLHGILPEISQDRVGEYHPSDYSVHFGSGNIKNIGTPDEGFIDTEALTKKMQALRLRLVTSSR